MFAIGNRVVLLPHAADLLSWTESGNRVVGEMNLGPLFEAALYASDLGAAENFYHDVLGLEVVSKMEGRGIAFRCGETVLLVFDPERTRIPDAGVPTHGAIGQGHIAFTIGESEIEPWRQRLRKRGVPIEAEIEWPVGGRSVYFRDPAGNVVELAPPSLWGMKKTSPR